MSNTLNGNITHIKIKNSDIFIEDISDNAGKITISDTEYDYNFSKYWGSMGSNIFNFLLQADEGYFAGKLLGHEKTDEVDIKGSFNVIRKYIEESVYEGIVKGYKYPLLKKYFNNEFEYFENNISGMDEKDFFTELCNLQETLKSYISYDLVAIDSIKHELSDFIDSIYNFDEYFVYKATAKYLWLVELNKNLKKELKSIS